jgi:hypothetical protein
MGLVLEFDMQKYQVVNVCWFKPINSWPCVTIAMGNEHSYYGATRSQWNQSSIIFKHFHLSWFLFPDNILFFLFQETIILQNQNSLKLIEVNISQRCTETSCSPSPWEENFFENTGWLWGDLNEPYHQLYLRTKVFEEHHFIPVWYLKVIFVLKTKSPVS